MLIRSFLTILVIGALARQAHAQVNTDSLQKQSLNDGWSGEVGANVVVTRGNVDYLEVGGNIRAQWQELYPLRPCDDLPFVKERIVAAMNGQFLEVDGDVFISQAFAHLRYVRMWLPRVGVDAAVQYQFDDVLHLKRRLVAGATLRLALIYRRSWQLHLGTGYIIEVERRDIQPEDFPEPRDALNHRWLNYMVLDIPIGERSHLQNTIYVEPRFDDRADMKILESMVLRVGITARVSMNIGFEFQHDSRPLPSVDATDIRVKNSLALSF